MQSVILFLRLVFWSLLWVILGPLTFLSGVIYFVCSVVFWIVKGVAEMMTEIMKHSTDARSSILLEMEKLPVLSVIGPLMMWFSILAAVIVFGVSILGVGLMFIKLTGFLT